LLTEVESDKALAETMRLGSEGEVDMACRLAIKFPTKDVPGVLSAFGIEPGGDIKAEERQLRLIFDEVKLGDKWCIATAARAKGGFCTELGRLACGGIIFFGSRQEEGMEPVGVYCLGVRLFDL
jgi:hypothetical protein